MAKRKQCDHEWTEMHGEVELTEEEWESVDDGEVYIFRCVLCGMFILEQVEGILGRNIGDKPLRKWS